MSISKDEIKRRLRLGGEDSSWEFKEVRFRGNKPVEPTRDDWLMKLSLSLMAQAGIWCVVLQTIEWCRNYLPSRRVRW